MEQPPEKSPLIFMKPGPTEYTEDTEKVWSVRREAIFCRGYLPGAR